MLIVSVWTPLQCRLTDSDHPQCPCDFGLRGLAHGSWLLRCGVMSVGKTLHLHVLCLNAGVNG